MFDFCLYGHYVETENVNIALIQFNPFSKARKWWVPIIFRDSVFCLWFVMHYVQAVFVREPAILLIKWLRPKGLKVCSYVEKYAELKNQTVKKNRLVH